MALQATATQRLLVIRGFCIVYIYIYIYIYTYIYIYEQLHKVRHPRCVYNKLDWSVYTCLTQLYDDRDVYIIYYIKNNYMFRHFIGHLQVDKCKNLVSSYTRLVCVVCSGEVSGEVGTRSRTCCVGWVVRTHGFCYFCYSRLIQLDLWYHLMFVEIICTCTLSL